MSKLYYMIIGAALGTIIYSCAMGGKSIKYKDFPLANDVQTIWLKCTDGDVKNVCKNICMKYKKNYCVEKRVKKLSISKALDEGYVMLSRELFIEMLRKSIK